MIFSWFVDDQKRFGVQLSDHSLEQPKRTNPVISEVGDSKVLYTSEEWLLAGISL